MCAALKQAMDDTVCAAFRKGVHRSLTQLASHKLLEDDTADIKELYLNSAFTWHAASDDEAAAEAFSRVEDAVVREVCTRVKAAVTSTLCRLLQQTIKDAIEQHSTECVARCQREAQQPKVYERPRTSVRSIALVFTVGFLVASLLAATLVPGAPFRSAFDQILQPYAPTTGSSNQPAGGGASGSRPSGVSVAVSPPEPIATELSLSVNGRNVSGYLIRADSREGLGGQTIALTLNSIDSNLSYEVQTSSDGSFSYNSPISQTGVQADFRASGNYSSSRDVWNF